jgi:hypothetical protein
MRLLSNLNWPETPFGADKRPYGRKVQLVAGLAMQWADDGENAIPISAGAVFLPVKRTQLTRVEPSTLHYGFRVAVAHGPGDAFALLRLMDGILVQGRRHAAALAWHAFQDDLHVTRTLSTERLPGFTAVGAAWTDRVRRERGTAPLVDTAVDLGEHGGVGEVAKVNGIELGWLADLQHAATLQANFEALDTEPERHGAVTDELAAGVLSQALTVALLGGLALHRIIWQEPFDLGEALQREAWHALLNSDRLNTPTPPAPGQ